MSTVPVAVGVGLIVFREDQVLLVRRKGVEGSGTWSTPDGHLEYGETFEECALREALEETGVTARDVEFVAVTNEVHEREQKHAVTVWMRGSYTSGTAEARAQNELDRVEWFRWDSLPVPLFLPFMNLLEGRCYPRLDTSAIRNGRWQRL